MIKVIKLPLLYACFLGISINLLHIKLGGIFLDAANDFRGAFIVLGMMMIGLGLASIKHYTWDKTFLGYIFLCKFLLWPLLMLFIITIDVHTIKLLNPLLHKLLLIMSLVPLAADTVSYATTLKAQPEKASLAVLLSTLFALFYIPFIVAYFLR
ncbi:MAG TPA: hypothetical protein VLF89_01065 [Candidatus Saccharimonadales bacterium]|nr:hypothetical protein [Candidatus Saccharimonadales bacterium]